MVENKPSGEPSSLDEALGRALAGQLVTGQGMAILLELVNRNLIEIKELLKVPIDEKPRYVTIPDQGGTFPLPVGTTTIDFHAGTITLPTGTVLNLRMNLKQFNIEKMRSVMFVCTAPLMYSFDGGGQFSLKAGEKIALGDFPFKYLYFQTAVPNSIQLMAAVTPQFTVFYDRYFANEFIDSQGPLNQSIYSADLTKPQTVSLDLGATTGRMLIEAFANSDVATTFTLSTSSDNVHWFVVETETTTAYSFGGGNCLEFVQLASAAAGTPGNKISMSLSAIR
jgi:hypothetical protein